MHTRVGDAMCTPANGFKLFQGSIGGCNLPANARKKNVATTNHGSKHVENVLMRYDVLHFCKPA